MGSKTGKKVDLVADTVAGVETDQHETAEGRIDQSIGRVYVQHDRSMRRWKVEGGGWVVRVRWKGRRRSRVAPSWLLSDNGSSRSRKSPTPRDWKEVRERFKPDSRRKKKVKF